MDTDCKGQRLYMPLAYTHSIKKFLEFFTNYLGFHSRLLANKLILSWISS